MIGITERRPPELVLQEALDKLAALSHPRCSVALSPHAPYSTVAKLLRMTADVARRRDLLLCTHVAESETEFDMFVHGRGEMFDWLRRSGRDMSDCGSGTPVQHLGRCGLLGKNLVAAHANYLGRGDAALLAKRQVSVVHCPRSHDFFHHDPLPLRRLFRSGVNVCLGTDSLATVVKPRHQAVELNMFAEMRLLAERYSWLSPKTILRMATINGARALGRSAVSGQLSKGAQADLISLPVSAECHRADEAVLEYRGSVAASMINGSWALPPS
jgi:cytosine/adenosine deaminase-related metal-dependent hydrolase